MSRWNILITAPRACLAIDAYRRALEPAGCRLLVNPPEERHNEVQLLPLVGDVDGIVCGDDRITARVLDAAPRLRVIAKWGTGIDSIDREAAREKGVAVFNTPDAFSEPVADSVLGYILLFSRKLDTMSADMRSGLWMRRPLVSLRECTLGIIGYGHIGRAVARRATAFHMPVFAHDICPIEDVAASCGVKVMPLDELLSSSAFVTLHTDMRPENHHLIDASRLRHLRPSAVLINTARGALVDERALADAIREGRLAGAALDVFEDEPLPQTSPLRVFPNVYLAPHNSNSSPMAEERVHANTIRNLLQALGMLKS